MRIIDFENGYKIVADTFYTRDGFGHDARLMLNDREIFKAEKRYLNRTWERYCYQSVSKAVISKAEEWQVAILKNDYMIKNHFSKMTKNRKEDFEKNVLLKDDLIQKYHAMRSRLENEYFG